eukprot:Skav211339  [mRNA]  locus=scaffold3120:305454:309829:+ [translate_table: standard]
MQFHEVVFEGFPKLCATWTLRIGDRAALAGPSKAGKSLQIQLISGELPVQSGQMVFDPEISRIALLRSGWIRTFRHPTVQEELEASDPPVPRGEVLPGGSKSFLVDVKPREVGAAAEIHQQILQFELQPCDRLKELPPGTLLRVAMAKLMFWQPDVLLLDDVTDDLDEDAACSWMEDFLLSKGLKILLVASHDRSFMDRVCNRVVAIQGNRTDVLEGNYGRAYLSGEFLHFHSFSLWQPKSSPLRATQAACAFASLVANDFCRTWEQRPEGVCNIVDVGTGTGILSLIIAQQWSRFGGKPDLQLWAIDLDEPSLRIARANFDSCPWADRIHAHHSSFKDWSPEWHDPPMSFICNPPYNDDSVNGRAGTEVQELSRRRALERSFLPLEELCRGAERQGCRSVWILWGNMEDAPVLQAAANCGWHAVRQVRFQRNVHSRQAFATVWHLKLLQSDRPLEPETILWQDSDGTPSTAWWQLVGSLYYWHMRPKKKLSILIRWCLDAVLLQVEQLYRITSVSRSQLEARRRTGALSAGAVMSGVVDGWHWLVDGLW